MGDAQLVKQFLENRDAILAFTYALTRDYDVAEEIFQNVALVILEEARRTPNVGDFMAWAREVVRRRVAEYYRKNAKQLLKEQPSGSMAEVVSQAFQENDITAQASHTRMKALLECLERLTDRSRQVIEGFYRGRKSIRDIASGLAWTENSVKVALSRARKVLADCVQTKLLAQEAI